MSKWIRLSDREPTESDAVIDGRSILMCEPSKGFTRCFTVDLGKFRANKWQRDNYYWLCGVPEPPRIRTLEEVVKEYVYNAANTTRRLELEKEMKEILGGNDDE